MWGYYETFLLASFLLCSIEYVKLEEKTLRLFRPARNGTIEECTVPPHSNSLPPGEREYYFPLP